MDRFILPGHLISVLSEEIANSETHASMNNLFMYANAPGDPPDGTKLNKAQEWFCRINKDEQSNPLEVLGYLVEAYMEPSPPKKDWGWGTDNEIHEERANRIKQALTRSNLQYIPVGKVINISASPSQSLKDFITKTDYASVNQEFDRALKNVEISPREAISASCNILESIFKIYIEEHSLLVPKKQDLQSLWKVVRDDLGIDPTRIEDRDLLEILSGIFATVNGIGALRTHASSAHGAGKKIYNLKPRHARLAIHSAHTLATFILESWHKEQ